MARMQRAVFVLFAVAAAYIALAFLSTDDRKPFAWLAVACVVAALVLHAIPSSRRVVRITQGAEEQLRDDMRMLVRAGDASPRPNTRSRGPS